MIKHFNHGAGSLATVPLGKRKQRPRMKCRFAAALGLSVSSGSRDQYLVTWYNVVPLGIGCYDGGLGTGAKDLVSKETGAQR